MKFELESNNNNIFKFKFMILYFFILLSTKHEIKIIYFFSDNFGDNLNNILLKKIIGKNIKFYNPFNETGFHSHDEKKIKILNEISTTDFIFIGSILEILANWTYIFKNKASQYKTIISKWYFKIYDYFHPLIIFGTGFIIQKNITESYIRNLKIIAVRGNITLQRLKNNRVKVSKSVVLADPAILTPLFFNFNNRMIPKKIYQLCIIPHYIDQDHFLIRKKIHVSNSTILNITENPIKFIYNLLKCKRVISSSLHGLIISDSFGIPNARIIFSNKIVGGDYKFNDYYSSFGMDYHLKIDLRNNFFNISHMQLIDNNKNKVSLYMIKKKQCQLLKYFPFKFNKILYLKRIFCKKKIF